jgi:hypothetical protein
MLAVLMAVNALSVVWFLFRNANGFRLLPARLPSAPLPSWTTTWTPPLGLGVVLSVLALAFVTGMLAMWNLRPETAEQGEPSESLKPSQSLREERVRDPESLAT